MTIAKKFPSSKSNKIPAPRKMRIKPRPKNAISHGAYSDPLDAYKSWKKHQPALAKQVESLYRSYSRFLNIVPKDPRAKALKILCCRVVTRDLLIAITFAKGFSMPVPSLGIIRPHFLMAKVGIIDDQIQQQLRDFGLIAAQD